MQYVTAHYIQALWHQPETGVPVMLKRGPYGLYVQLVSE
jgi:topoisomerase IA-like protein